jgi:hypothetical protein
VSAVSTHGQQQVYSKSILGSVAAAWAALALGVSGAAPAAPNPDPSPVAPGGLAQAAEVAMAIGFGEDTPAGAQPAKPGCAGCAPAQALVFISSSKFTGRLGGILGADAKCQAHARAAKLPGTYKAWISDSSGSSPARSFTRSRVPYRLVDGTLVADNWDDLTDGTLDAQISRDEYGDPLPRLTRGVSYWWVWTATRTDGSAMTASSFGGGFCTAPGPRDWESENASGYQVGAGFNGLGSTRNDILGLAWTADGTQPCNLDAHLYCFQQ